MDIAFAYFSTDRESLLEEGNNGSINVVCRTAVPLGRVKEMVEQWRPKQIIFG